MRYRHPLIIAALWGLSSAVAVAADSQGQADSDRPAAAKQEGTGTGQASDPTTTQKQNSPREDPAYSAEAKKCESMQGSDKEKCISSAKKKPKDM